MDTRLMPTIRLEIEGIKGGIISALGLRDDSFKNYIESEIDKCLNDLDLTQLVKDTIVRCVHEQISDYFTIGLGADAIRDSLKDCFITTRQEEEESG